DAMLVVDRSGTVVFANRQATAMFGKDLAGATIESLLPERFRDRHVGHREGGDALIVAAIRDVTDRKRAEAEIHAARAAADRANQAKSRFLAAASHDL